MSEQKTTEQGHAKSAASELSAGLGRISPPMAEAWAERCGISSNDERAVFADKYGWPHDFKYFRSGWDAACAHAAERLGKAGATLPAPDATGTVEGAVNTGLCVAMALVDGMRSNV